KISKYIDVPNLKKTESILPIGLLSSGLLGNLVLKEFDKKIKEEINPSYYGRYVDDILLVTTNFKVEETAISPVNKFLFKYFVKRGLFGLSNIPKEFRSKKADGKEEYFEPKAQSFSDREIVYHKLLAEDVKFNLTTNPSLEIQSKKVILQNFNSL
ncbi:reverse transcriptase domain-containing protein, partial [Roseateles chitinivorans]|uniref:reverse transcriptase domain-containing protein n=1 Tax=Roseateles chitinivorans TaxID=2917965 RepID=UPI0021755F0C